MTREEAMAILEEVRTIDDSMYQYNPAYLEALDMSIEALKAEPCEDAVSREALLSLKQVFHDNAGYKTEYVDIEDIEDIKTLPPVIPKQRWIPVSERLPEDLEPVNITWVNHDPESYYMDIKDKPFTATGVYFNGQWYWWSTLCTDMLAEYGHNYSDIIDDAIEVTAWMPLPKPYKENEE